MSRNVMLFEAYKEYISNKRVAVIGLGISNMPLIRFLNKIGVKEIIAFDLNDSQETVEKVDNLKSEGLIKESHLGKDYLSYLPNCADVIFKTPIVRFDTPELLEAEKCGAIVTSEIETLINLCPAKIFGITGSDGKTTTTTIIYKFLFESAKGKVWVGGNIGTPLLQYVEEMTEDDIVVLELSSFQLMNIKASTDVAVITNISPNHLDVHKSYDEYIDAKKMIYEYQENRVVILNKDNSVTNDISKELSGDIRLFSYDNSSECGAWYRDGVIYYSKDGRTEKVIDRDDIMLLGRHNVENYLAAISAVYDYVSLDDIKNVAKTFGGVAHRMQLVRTLDGVKYYNSSIDSSPNRTVNALSVFENKTVVLIAGGKDKNIPYDMIGAPIADKVKTLILTGPTAEKIETAVLAEFDRRNSSCDLEIIHCKTYDEAVYFAHKFAKAGDFVVLSPASTSFDMFKNFEHRGNCYAEYVNKLPYKI